MVKTAPPRVLRRGDEFLGMEDKASLPHPMIATSSLKNSSGWKVKQVFPISGSPPKLLAVPS